MVPSVAARLHDEFRVVPRQEHDGVHRFHVALVLLRVEHAFAGSRLCVIRHEFSLVLRAWEFKHVDCLFVGTPCDVGEIAVGRVAGLQEHRLVGGWVKHADSHFVARHAGHRVFLWCELRHAVGDVHHRIVGHHRLVHAVKRQQVALGAPERTFRNAKLVAVDAHAILQFACAVGGHLMAFAVGRCHEEVPVFHVSLTAASAVVVACLHTAFARCCPFSLLRFPVVEHVGILCGQESQGLSCVGESGVGEVVHLAHFGRVDSGVDLFNSEEHALLLLLLSFLVKQRTNLVNFRFEETVAPPSREGT